MASPNLIEIMILLAALGTGLVAGVFYGFSTFVMKALARLPAPQGIAAMQSINVVVLNRWFFAVFFGTAGACAILVIYSLIRWPSHAAAMLLVGSALYLVGVIAVTIAFNVPLNNALAGADPGGAAAERLWARYLSVWTAWNHVRTAAPLLAAVVLATTLR